LSIREVCLSDIGEGVIEAEIIEWHVAVGDTVEEDQIVGALMTDKVAVDIPSPFGGIITALGGEVGDVVAVGAVLARIDDVTGNNKETGNACESSGQIDEIQDRNKTLQIDSVTHPTEAKVLVMASPAVRRRALERGISLHDVPSSEKGSRVTHADLDRFLFDSTSGISGPKAPISELSNNKVNEIRVIGLRRHIAQHMELASRRIPHFSYIEEIDVTELESLRHALASSDNGSENPALLSPLPFIIQAIVRALDEFPGMNAQYDDDAGILKRFSSRHVGVATHAPEGLMVPVIKNAERLDIHGLAAEIRQLAKRTREGLVTREELTGSTITVTSLGALGGLATTPIINHPEVAIIGVNRIGKRPVCYAESIVTRQMMNLSSSFDHRVVDGHEAADFIQCIRRFIEHPATLFLPAQN